MVPRVPADELIERYDLHLVTALPLRLAPFGRVGPFSFWALASLALFALSVSLLWGVTTEGWMYLAFGLASVGLFLCCWGSVAGLGALLGQVENFERSLAGPRDAVQRLVTDRLRSWTSVSRTVAIAIAFGTGITTCFVVQNVSQPATEFAQAFDRTSGGLYVPLFLSASSIGVGHACIAGALGVAGTFRQFGLRRTYSPARLRYISVTYLGLGTLSLLTYATFLGVLLTAWLLGVGLSPATNALIVAVGGVVVSVYLYPQWRIHRAMVANRDLLVAEAVARVESIRSEDAPLTDADCDRILKSIEYVRAMEAFPTIGFRWRELAGVIVGYVLPAAGFLAAQASRLKAIVP